MEESFHVVSLASLVQGLLGGETMTDFYMPDSFYDPPDEEEQCTTCDGNGCHLCDEQIAREYMADIQMQTMKEEPDLYG
jgi:hypothetical protein